MIQELRLNQRHQGHQVEANLANIKCMIPMISDDFVLPAYSKGNEDDGDHDANAAT